MVWSERLKGQAPDRSTYQSSSTFIPVSEDSLRRTEEVPFFGDVLSIDVDTSNQPVMDYAPSFQSDVFRLNTGRPQSPGYFLDNLNLSQERGFDLFPRYIEPFRVSEETTPMRFSNIGFADIHYSQASQEETYLNVEFTKTFREKNDVHLWYNNVHDIGDYDNEKLRHNNVAFYWQVRNSQRRRFRLAYFGNYTEDEQNGGIVTDTNLNNDDFSNRLAINVYLSEEEKISHEDHHFFAEWRQQVGKTKDQTSPLTLFFRPFYRSARQSYADRRPFSSSEGDFAYYHTLLALDTAHVNYRTSMKAYGGLLGINIKTSFLHFYGKAMYASEKYDWFLFADSSSYFEDQYTHLALSSGLKIKVGPAYTQWYAEWRNFRDQGIYQLKGEGTLEVSTGLSLFGTLSIESRIPQLLGTYQANRVFDANFSISTISLQEIGLGGRLKLGPVKARLLSRFSRIENYPFFDHSGRLQQNDDPLNLRQIEASFHLERRIYDWENHLLLSSSENTILRRPSTAYRTRLSLKQRWFKNRLTVRIGAQYTYLSSYLSYYFSPWHQALILGNESYGPFHDVDAFLNIQVKSFRFMFMYENLHQLLTDEAEQYIQGYPQRDPGIRLGVSWRFLD